MLDQFDEAVALGNEGRTAHLGATLEIRAVSWRSCRAVCVTEGRNRQRFAENEQLLGSWISRRNRARDASADAGPEGGTPA
jgi:hypothetical protein